MDRLFGRPQGRYAASVTADTSEVDEGRHRPANLFAWQLLENNDDGFLGLVDTHVPLTAV
jgi:hypothetical protein